MQFQLPILILISALFLQSHCAPESDKDREIVNNVFNRFLEAVRTKYRHLLNPYKLPDDTFDFHQSLVFFNVRVVVELYDGKASGLLTMKRLGDFDLNRTSEDIIQASGKLTLRTLAFAYKAKVNAYASVTTDVVATVGSTIVDCSLLLNETSAKVEFERFKVEDISDFNIKLDNNGGWLSKVVNYLLSGLQRLFKTTFRNLIDRKLTEIAKAYMSTVEFEG